jgi:hypothetical protein
MNYQIYLAELTLSLDVTGTTEEDEKKIQTTVLETFFPDENATWRTRTHLNCLVAGYDTFMDEFNPVKDDGVNLVAQVTLDDFADINDKWNVIEHVNKCLTKLNETYPILAVNPMFCTHIPGEN